MSGGKGRQGARFSLRQGASAGRATTATRPASLTSQGGADVGVVGQPGPRRGAARHHQSAADAANAGSKQASGKVGVQDGMRGGQAMAVEEGLKVGVGRRLVVGRHVFSGVSRSYSKM